MANERNRSVARLRPSFVTAILERMFEDDAPLHVFVAEDGDGLAHVAVPGAERFLCGLEVGASRRLHGNVAQGFRGCWACYDAEPPR